MKKDLAPPIALTVLLLLAGATVVGAYRSTAPRPPPPCATGNEPKECYLHNNMVLCRWPDGGLLTELDCR